MTNFALRKINERSMEIPFVYGKIADGTNFTDRTQDTEKLVNNFKGLVNTVIISPRRWGKTSLVNHALQRMSNENDYLLCQIDIFNCRTEAQFYQAYVNALLKASYTKMDEFIAAAKKYVGAFGPKLTLSDSSMQYELAFGIDFKDKQYSYDEILDLPQQIALERGKKFIVCIDEFQNLANLSEWKRIEGLLRSVWQQHQHTTYCLYGSKRHMMLDIFNNSSNPFYRFGQVMYLDKISKEYWIPYIIDTFSKSGKSISREAAERICDAVDCHSWYVQQLSFFVWADTENEATVEMVDNALLSVIDTNRPVFESDADKLSASQMAMLHAVANGEYRLNASEVVNRYNLGGPQTITRNKRVLVEKDIIEKRGDGFDFVDPLFRVWIIRG